LNRAGVDTSDNPKLEWGHLTPLLPVAHGASTARPFDLRAQGTTASSRRPSDRTTTWNQPVAVPADVTLGVNVAAGQSLARVVYRGQLLETSRSSRVVRRGPLIDLGESSTAPGFEVTARLARGKRMILAYGHDASGKLVGIDEITFDVGASAPPPQVDDAFE